MNGKAVRDAGGLLTAALGRARFLEPLRLRAFRTLWTGMTISLLGDGVTLVALAWQVYELTDAPTALGVTAMAMTIPQVALLLLGGVVSDRLDRRRVMLAADLVRGAALLCLGVLSIAQVLEIWHMILLAAVYGVGSAFFGPSFDAIVPELVPAEHLGQANSLDQMVRPIAARLFGPALGGWIVMSAGAGWAFVIDAGTFGLSAFFLFRLARFRPTGRAAGPSESGGGASLWSDLREGLAFVRSRVWLWGTFTAATLAYLVFLGPAEVLLPYLIKYELAGSAGDLGLVFALGGLGAVTASLVTGQRQLPHRPMTFIYVVWTVSTLMIAGYGLARSSWQVMLFCLAFNALESAGLIVWLTTKQLLVPQALLGRVSSLDWCISTGLMPVSYALAGPAAQLLGARPTLVGAGLLGAGITLIFLFLPGMRALEIHRDVPGPRAVLAAPGRPASDSSTY